MGAYPTPVEATNRFRTGVQLGAQKWTNNTLAGANDYQTWFSGFASVVYPIVASLPAKTGDVDRDVDARVKPVARAIRGLAQTYRATKLQKVAQVLAKVV